MQTPGNVTPHAEFNFYSDPTAARLVIESGVPITLIDMAPCGQVFLTREDVQASAPLHRGGRPGRAVAHRMVWAGPHARAVLHVRPADAGRGGRPSRFRLSFSDNDGR